MAAEYYLALQTELSPQQVRSLVLHIPGFEERQWDSDTAICAKGIASVTVMEESPSGRNIMDTALSFEPNVTAMFRLERYGSIEEGIANAVRAASELMRQCSSQAALIGENDQVLLKQEANCFIINTHFPFWRPERLILLTMPYQLHDMGNLYL